VPEIHHISAETRDRLQAELIDLTGRGRIDIAAQIEAARLLGLEEFLDRRPGELSGGQRQRVAMGRAIVRNPAVFLMDEPLSNLDAKLRVEMRAEISRLQKALAATTIYVTHDQTEAMTMGDRVVVLDRGVVQQVADPAELYERPVNVFVARFIGAPTMNLLRATAIGGALYVGEREMAGRGPVAQPLNLQQLCRPADALVNLIARKLLARCLERKFQVAPHAPVGIQSEVLEDQRNVAVGRRPVRHLFAVHLDLTSVGRV